MPQLQLHFCSPSSGGKCFTEATECNASSQTAAKTSSDTACSQRWHREWCSHDAARTSTSNARHYRRTLRWCIRRSCQHGFWASHLGRAQSDCFIDVEWCMCHCRTWGTLASWISRCSWSVHRPPSAASCWHTYTPTMIQCASRAFLLKLWPAHQTACGDMSVRPLVYVDTDQAMSMMCTNFSCTSCSKSMLMHKHIRNCNVLYLQWWTTHYCAVFFVHAESCRCNNSTLASSLPLSAKVAGCWQTQLTACLRCQCHWISFHHPFLTWKYSWGGHSVTRRFCTHALMQAVMATYRCYVLTFCWCTSCRGQQQVARWWHASGCRLACGLRTGWNTSCVQP